MKKKSKYDFFNLAPVSCCIISADGIILEINKSAGKMLGIDPGTVIDKQIFLYIVKEYHNSFRKLLKKVKKSGKPQNCELRMIKNDGKEIWASFEVTAADVDCTVYIAVMNDITGQKQFEDELLFTRFAVDNSADAILWLTKDGGRVVYANLSACRMLEYTDKEIKTLTIFDIDQNLPVYDWETNFDVLKHEKSLHFESVHKTKNGKFIPVDVTATYVEFGDKIYNCAFIRNINVRKQIEQSLRESEERFRTVFEEAHIGILIVNPSLLFEKANPEFCRMIGYTEEELSGMTFGDITHPDHIKNDFENVKKVGSGELSFYQTEKRYKHKSGIEIWANVIISTIRDESGQLINYLAMVNDITARKLADKTLADSELKYRTLFKTMGQGFYISRILYDENNSPYDFQYLDVNSAFEEIIGLKKEKLIGKTYNEIVPPDPESGWLDCFKRVVNSGSPEHYIFTSAVYNTYFEVYAFKPENDKFAALVKDISKQKQEEEELKKYREHLEEIVKERTEKLERINVNLQSEITMRMQAEKELAEERNLLRTLIDNLPDQIYAKDTNHRFTMVNSTVIKFLKREKIEDVLGKTIIDFYPSEDVNNHLIKEQELINSGQMSISYEVPVNEDDGNIRWYMLNKIPLKDNHGNIMGLVGIDRDITPFKNIEENLQKAKDAAEAANRSKSIFLSSMSHEIRTPLNSILGFSQLMMYAENLNQDQREWIEMINKSGEYLLALINDILEISKIEAGRAVFSSSGFNLHSMLNDIEAMIRSRSNEKKLSLLMEISDDLPGDIITDEVKLRQILINILINAVKFTQEGGIGFRVKTGRDESGQMILIAEIEDTGIGITPDEINNLFKMFWQSEAGIKEGGTGLGLVISKEYAKMLGGDITVRSELGKGSCFTVKVKFDIEEESGSRQAISRKRVIGIKPGQKKYLILIADDRKENRLLLNKILSGIGFEIIEAVDGKDALEKFSALKPDLILMDMRMPLMDGYEATRRIKEIDGKNTPIIAVTASAFYEDRKKIIDAGVNAYLRKPFKEYEIFNAIQSFLGVRYVYDEK
jgi:PAS domain S-box-containing protein